MFAQIKKLFTRNQSKTLGGYHIADPRPLARDNPYTFQMPSAAELLVLAPGNAVKLIFDAVPASEKAGPERMWVTILSRDGNRFTGRLENEPFHIPGLTQGDILSFESHHIIAIYWEDEEVREQFDDGQDIWFARARVDPRITEEGLPVRFLFREEPAKLEGSAYPDTGWRLCADEHADLDAIDAPYMAIGVVLNRDDSFLELLSAKPGQAFQRPPDATGFLPITLQG